MNGFLKTDKGSWSNSRLIADIIVIWGLVLSTALLIIKVVNSEVNIMEIATAVGVIFASIAGPALAFLFVQKKTESQTKLNENQNPIVP